MPTRLIKTFLLLNLLLGFGCQGCDECRSFENYYRFRFIPPWSLSLLDNSGPAPIEDADSTINRNAFGLRISCPAELIDSVAEDVEEYCIEWAADTAITSIKVLTVSDLDSTYKAGSDISALFKLRKSEYLNSSLTSHVIYDDIYGFNEHYNDYQPVTQIELLMVSPPTQSGIYQFDVVITRSDLSQTYLRTPKITLQ
jgi:hypothetical protein